MDFGGSLLWFEDGLCIQNQNNLELLPLEIMHSLSSEIHNQNVEMDHFLRQQNNILRRSIMEEEARRRAVTMQRYESVAASLMLQKEEEIAAARGRTRELQRFVKAAEVEAAAWERAAREGEAAAAELRGRLDQVMREQNDVAAAAATSFCSSSSSSPAKRNWCKVCDGGISSVVLFPCRHICCCRSCEPLLERCPLCQTLKEATLQVCF